MSRGRNSPRGPKVISKYPLTPALSPSQGIGVNFRAVRQSSKLFRAVSRPRTAHRPPPNLVSVSTGSTRRIRPLAYSTNGLALNCPSQYLKLAHIPSQGERIKVRGSSVDNMGNSWSRGSFVDNYSDILY
jgi:hypothetical protein